MGGNCGKCGSCNVEERKYFGDDCHDQRYNNEIISAHQHGFATGSQCIDIRQSLQICESDDMLRADGRILKTDRTSLADVDGDGDGSSLHFVEERKYFGDDCHDQRYNNEIQSAHQNGFVSGSCIRQSLQICESDQMLRADGHILKTDCTSLVDADGDGVEPEEVIRAVFMLPTGHESHYMHEGTELLYPEIDFKDADRSALEVMLRNQIKQLDEKLEKMVIQVTNHRDELKDDHARETHEFLLQRTAHIAKEAADLGVLLCSDNLQAHHVVQKRMFELSKGADEIAQHLAAETEAETKKETGTFSTFFL